MSTGRNGQNGQYERSNVPRQEAMSGREQRAPTQTTPGSANMWQYPAQPNGRERSQPVGFFEQYYGAGQNNQARGAQQQPYGGGQYRPPQRPVQQDGRPQGGSVAGMQQPYWGDQSGRSQRSGPPSVVSSNTGSRSARSADGTGATRQDPRGPSLSNGAADALKYSMERFMGERQREEEPWKMVGSFRYVPVDQSNQNGRASGRR